MAMSSDLQVQAPQDSRPPGFLNDHFPAMTSPRFTLSEGSCPVAAGCPQPTAFGTSDLSSRLSRKRKNSDAMEEALPRLESDKAPSPGPSNVSDQSDTASKRIKFPRRGSNGGSPAALPLDKSNLPAELWQHIFLFLPPWTLGKLLRVNKKFFKCLTAGPGSLSADVVRYHGILKCIDPSVIWATSRRNCDSSIPRPLMHRSELDMWKLILGRNCQFCQKPEMPVPKDSTPWERGPGQENVRLIWPFGIRSCGNCLHAHSMKVKHAHQQKCAVTYVCYTKSFTGT